MQRQFYVFGGAALLVIGGLLLLSALQSGANTVNAQNVQTATIERTDLNNTIETSGTIAPERTLYLSFGTAGNVALVNVREGDPVTAGQILATLDTVDLEYQISLNEQTLAIQQSSYNRLTDDPTTKEITQAESAVASAESQLTTAQNSLDKVPNQQIVNCANVDGAQRKFNTAQDDYDAYVNEGYEWDATFSPDPDSAPGIALNDAANALSVAQAQCDNTTPESVAQMQVSAAEIALQQAQASLDALLAGATADEIVAAEAQVTQAQLQLDNARANLADAQIVAPFDGIIAAVDIIPGQKVTQGTVVITLVDTNQLHVDVTIDELDIPQVVIGQTVTISPEALNGQTVDGTVTLIAPIAQVTSGVVTYAVRVDLAADTPLPLRVGMTTDVEIIVSAESGVLVVATDAIQRRGTTEYVQVLNVDGTTEEVTIETGITVDDLTVITGQINEGTTVVVPERNPSSNTFGGPFGG